jgi:hypothetical protein
MIETLTAFSAVKIVWETLEILHLAHVGYITGKAGYKGGSSIKHAIQQQQQKWQDQKDPVQQLVGEAETDYDLKATGDAAKAIQKYDKRVQTYLNLLHTSLGNLNDAKRYFLETHHSLAKLVNALQLKDEQEFLSNLSKFKINFESFKDKLNLFSLSIKPPDRKDLYIVDITKRKREGAIEKFNKYLNSIDDCFKKLKDTKEKIVDLFKNDFHVISTSLSEASSGSALSFEQLKQQIRGCMDKPELIPKTMQKILSKNMELAVLCTDIAQISTAFKQNHKTDNQQTDLWNNDPDWFPLLTEEEQIEKGQRIFLHAMNETNYPGTEKSGLAKIFLRQHVSVHEINQLTIDLLSQELANLLIVEKIKKCEKLIQFLKELTPGGSSREHDPYGLLEWLEITRHTQSSVELWIKILVSPYCLNQYHIESLRPKLETLLPHENTDALVEKYRASYWGAIREKSDKLIALPASFKTNIIPNDRFQKDDQSEDSNVVSCVMSKLSETLIIELETLQAELYKKKEVLDPNVRHLYKKAKDARDDKENLEHENGIERIKESHRYISPNDSSNDASNDASKNASKNLCTYLYSPETINEVEKEWQVPTIADLVQVIYRGVDLHGVCKCKGNPNTKPNLLLDYFYPNQQNDSRMEAFVYAVNKCQVTAWPLLQLFSYPAQPLLAIGNGDAKSPSLVFILKNTVKIPVPANSMALNNLSPKTKEETETFINQLDDYYNLSLMRLRPELRNELPLVEQFKLLVKSLFNLGQEIRKERFESVQIIMGKLHAVVSAEDVEAINKALDDLERNYEGRCQGAQRTKRSALYTILKKAFYGPISDIRNQFTVIEPQQVRLELEEQLKESKEIIEEMKQEKAELEAKLKESEAKRAQYEVQQKESEAKRAQYEMQQKDSEAKLEQEKAELDAKLEQEKAELDAKLEQDKAELDAKFNEFEAKMKKVIDFMDCITSQQPGSSFSAAEAQTQESSNLRFFRL